MEQLESDINKRIDIIDKRIAYARSRMYLAIFALVLTVLAFVMCWIWYGPKLFLVLFLYRWSLNVSAALKRGEP